MHGVVHGPQGGAASGPRSCSVRWASPTRLGRRAPTPTSCPGACANGCSSPSPSPASPTVLIADEPTTALDVTIQAQVLDLFARLQAKLGMGLLLVTHDVGVARQVADRVAVMYAGRLVEEGPGAIVLDDPAHPYTSGLLRCRTRRQRRPGELRAIAGHASRRLGEAVGRGVPFAPRCSAVRGVPVRRPGLIRSAPCTGAACPVLRPRCPSRSGHRRPSRSGHRSPAGGLVTAPILLAEHLSKRFDNGVLAVDDVSLRWTRARRWASSVSRGAGSRRPAS